MLYYLVLGILNADAKRPFPLFYLYLCLTYMYGEIPQLIVIRSRHVNERRGK